MSASQLLPGGRGEKKVQGLHRSSQSLLQLFWGWKQSAICKGPYQPVFMSQCSPSARPCPGLTRAHSLLRPSPPPGSGRCTHASRRAVHGLFAVHHCMSCKGLTLVLVGAPAPTVGRWTVGRRELRAEWACRSMAGRECVESSLQTNTRHTQGARWHLSSHRG